MKRPALGCYCCTGCVTQQTTSETFRSTGKCTHSQFTLLYSSSTVNDHSTVSTLRFVPKFTDNRASLICRACNEALAKKGACQSTGGNGRGNSNQWTGLHRDRNGHYGHANKSQTIRLDANAAAVPSFYLESLVLLDVNCKCPLVIKTTNLSLCSRRLQMSWQWQLFICLSFALHPKVLLQLSWLLQFRIGQIEQSSVQVKQTIN